MSKSPKHPPEDLLKYAQIVNSASKSSLNNPRKSHVLNVILSVILNDILNVVLNVILNAEINHQWDMIIQY